MKNGKLIGIRNQKGLKQATLARMIGTTQPQMSRYESGTVPPADIQEKLAKVLECSITDLGFTANEETFLSDPDRKENAEEAPAEKDQLDLHSGEDRHPFSFLSVNAFLKPRFRFVRINTIIIISLVSNLLLAFIVFYVPIKSKIYPDAPSSIPLQRINHTTNMMQPSLTEREAVIIRTKNQTNDFTWTGNRDVSIDNVISIDTGNKIISFLYIQNGKKEREPDNFDMHLHVCEKQIIQYDPPIQVIRLYIIAPSSMVRCVPRSSQSPTP